MAIYWSMNSVPELDGITDKKQKRQLFGQMQREGARRLGKNTMMARFAIAASALLVFIIVVLLGQSHVSGLGFLPILLLCGVMGAMVGAIPVLIIQTPVIEKGREWLREQGYPRKGS